MTKKEKFDVAVAAFEALLDKNKLWEEYLMNFSKCKLKGDLQEIYTNWKNWASSTPPYQWVAGGFIWDSTPQGHTTWHYFDYDWLKWICKNLNK